jgi:hypothetical protein
MVIPQHFCWSRFGVEAGEQIDAILTRKEIERVGNNGIFFWGIGSALGPSMRRLLHITTAPKAIFSPIRSAPKDVDVNPGAIVRWTVGRTLDGREYKLPAASVVTSRANAGSRKCHYALVCASRVAIKIGTGTETLALGQVRNLLTDRPVGASQVTAVVRFLGSRQASSQAYYPAAMQFDLVFPYFVELTVSVPIEDRSRKGALPARRQPAGAQN